MGNSSSKRCAVPKNAGMTSESIERYYDALARYREACEDADNEEPLLGGSNYHNTPGGQVSRETDEDSFSPEFVDSSLADARSEIIHSNEVAPDTRFTAAARLDKALHAILKQDRDAFEKSAGLLIEFGVNIKQMVGTASDWVKAYPWEIATIVIPLVTFACTPAMLSAAGFTAGGIAAGKSSQTCGLCQSVDNRQAALPQASKQGLAALSLIKLLRP